MSAKLIEHKNTSMVVCPYCGHTHPDCLDWEDGQHVCARCIKSFEVDSYADRVFTTSKVYTCPICNRVRCPEIGRDHGRLPRRKGGGAMTFSDAEVDAILQSFDATEPRLQRRIVLKMTMDRRALLAAADALLADRDADRDADPKDQAAARRLYNAWVDLREARFDAHT